MAEIARRVLLGLCLTDAVYWAAQCQHVSVRHVLRRWPLRCAVWAFAACSALAAFPQAFAQPYAQADRLRRPLSSTLGSTGARSLVSTSGATSRHFGALGRHRSARSRRPLPHGFGLHGRPMPRTLCSRRPVVLAPLQRVPAGCYALSMLARSHRPLPNPPLKRTASGGRLAPR